MNRRNFLTASGIGLTGLLVPGFSHAVAAEALLVKMDPARKKTMADLALNAATAAGEALAHRRERGLHFQKSRCLSRRQAGR